MIERLESRVMLTADPFSANVAYSLSNRQAPLVVETSALTTSTKAVTAPVVPVLSASTTSLYCGEEITITAKLGKIKLDGQSRLEFYDNGILLSDAIVSNQTMTFTSDVLHAGSHSFTAIYYDANHNPSAVSNAVGFTIKQADPKLKLSIFQPGTPVASPVFQIDSTVLEMNKYSGDFDNYQGVFKLYEGNTLLNIVRLEDYVGGLWYKINTPLSQGTHTLTLTYSGGSDFSAGSTSLTVDIQPLKPAITLTLPPSVTPNTSFNIKATLSSAYVDITSGSISFYDGNVLLGTQFVNSNEEATLTVQNLSTGSHQITAKYNGNAGAGLGEATSAASTVVVSKKTSTITLTTSDSRGLWSNDNAASNEDSVELIADFSILGTGIISFYDGSKLLGTRATGNAGQVSFDTMLSIGTHNLTAVFEGNDFSLASSSNVVKEVIKSLQQIDLLVLYTNTVATDWADSDSIRDSIQLQVDDTNNAMINSNIYAKINIVQVQQVNYNDSGNYETDITRLASTTDGYMDDVAKLRNKYHADLVSLFVNDSQRGGSSTGLIVGLGSTLLTTAGDVNAAFSIIDINGPEYSLAHELGHNLGARHDKANDDGKTGFQTGHGYVYYENGEYEWHDIMAYGPDDPIPFYSNPKVAYNDVPTGTSSANAAGIINMNAAVVAGYSNLLPQWTAAVAPSGAITEVGTRTITGWAYDGNAGSGPTTVRIDIDGVAGQIVTANSLSPVDAPGYAFGKHGFVYSIPSTVAAGTHTITLYVRDAGNGKYVQIGSQSITVDPKPELAVTFGNSSLTNKTYKPGDIITTTVTVTNTGISDAVGTKDNPIKVNIYQSSDQTYDSGDTLIQTILLPYKLTSGASKTFTIKMQIPANTLEDIYLVAAVDVDGVVNEKSETDNTVVMASAMHVLWQFGTNTGSSSLTLTDDDGTKVTFKLSGPGNGQVIHSENGWNVVLSNTTTSSSFSITTSKSKLAGDDGRFKIHSILTSSDTDNLKSISAATTDLAGQLIVQGSLLSLVLGDVVSPSSIILGNAEATTQSPKMSFGAVKDLSITVYGSIQSISAADWKDTDGTTDEIIADSIGTLTTIGDRKRSLAGDFGANLTLTPVNGSEITRSLGSVRIVGALNSVQWNVNKDIGSVTVLGTTGDTASGWTLVTTGINVQSLNFKDVVNGSIQGYSSIGTITAERWQNGSIHAGYVKNINITGRKNAFAGDFAADLNISGYFNWSASPAVRQSIGQVTINGSLLASQWNIGGTIDTLTVKGSTGKASDSWVLTATGQVKNLNLGDVVNAHVTVLSDISAISVNRWQQGTLEASAITTMNVTGMKKSYSGDFSGSLILNGHGAATDMALKTLKVSGSISDATIRATGNIDTITVGSMIRSQLYAGLSPSLLSGLPSSGDFLNTAYTINSITFMGDDINIAVLMASSIAADTIKKVKLPSTDISMIDAEGTSDPFGFRTKTSAVAQYKGPNSFGNFVSGLDAVV